MKIQSLITAAFLTLPILAGQRIVQVTFTDTNQPGIVKGFNVYYRQSGQTNWPNKLSTVTTNTTISGLDSNIAYDFTATAYNDVGESDFAAPVSLSAVPLKPSDLKVVSQIVITNVLTITTP